jgi:flagellar biosynthetic protein FliQ
MNPAQVTAMAQDAIVLTLLLSAPLLIVGMVVGIIIALFQATTQIQEMTLTFVLKIFAVMVTLLFSASWMMIKLVDYTTNLFNSIPGMLR